MLLYPRLTQLDLTGPYEVFRRMTDTEIYLLWKTLAPVCSDTDLCLTPTMTLAGCPALDVLFVPGGKGQVDLMGDTEVLDFVRRKGEQASYVTSVCTGSLVLAAAGLLDGYRATCHWLSREFLQEFGIEVSTERVAVDRNRITGAGVTAGIDFALLLCGLLRGDAEAERLQLQLEYNPAPPYDSGSPDRASPATVDAAIAQSAELRAARHRANQQAIQRRRS